MPDIDIGSEYWDRKTMTQQRSSSENVGAHTPTPWVVGYPARLIVREIPGMCDGGDYYSVAEAKFHSLLLEEEAAANAAFIVKAVNSHDALVKALTDTLCELTACANQLAARGLKGHKDDSVSRAQAAARAALSQVQP